MYERTVKQSHLDTIRYEIDMLEFTTAELAKQSMAIPQMYVYLESFLLHYRNLIQFFAGSPPKHRQGDLSTHEPQVWAGRPQLTQAEIDEIQAPARKLENQYWKDISQFLQHCTDRRYSEFRDWNIETMFGDLKPVIRAFEQAFKRSMPIQASETFSGGNSTASFTKTGKIF